MTQKHIALFLACYIIFGSLLPHMDFGQLTRLGALRTHYLEHVEEAEVLDESCQLADFLYEHFICNHDDHEEEDDDGCHKDMPFHGINSSISFCLSLNFQTISFDHLKKVIETPVLEPASPLPGYLSGVFQPPAFG